jgi:hypothetical protein
MTQSAQGVPDAAQERCRAEPGPRHVHAADERRARDGVSVRSGIVTLLLLLLAAPLSAQDLDPRTYSYIPVNGSFLVVGLALSKGGLVTDATLPVPDLRAKTETSSVGFARSFSLFGRTAQAFGVIPYSWAQPADNPSDETANISRAGFSDMRLRLSVLVRGAPAAPVADIVKTPRRTILGTSLTVIAPTGQFFSDKVVNLGANRWAFKPEFAVSRPIGQRWLLDLYAALWMFTANDSFYPGTSTRTQAPLSTFQGHVSYDFRRQLWAAFDATYYVGGRSAVENVEADDRQSNVRLGGTVALPVGTRHSIKLAASRGAIVRFGTNFTTISVGWQTVWVDGE